MSPYPVETARILEKPKIIPGHARIGAPEDDVSIPRG